MGNIGEIMSTHKVRIIQQKEIDLLKIFDDICREHQLVYYALGGTLLGAIRHKGFIPWDDDMDLGMPRQDYIKFMSIAEDVLPQHIKLVVHEDNLNNTSIRDIGTVVTFGETDCNPFIDIFPLDGYPGPGIKRTLHDKHIMFYRMLSKISVVDQLLARDRGFIENTIVNVSRALHLNKLLNTKKINNKIQNVIKKYDFNTSPYAGNILGTYRDKEIVKRDIFGEPQRLEFDGFKISSHQQPEAYLTNVYGNFMEIPPVEKQQGHFESAYGK